MVFSYQARVTDQLRRLGGSCDWDRVAFTMNPVGVILSISYISNLVLYQSLSKAVTETFCRLHEDGIIYRANRLVNWCVHLNTTLSNLEVSRGISSIGD
jgi:valyl-tRNA synthetase